MWYSLGIVLIIWFIAIYVTTVCLFNDDSEEYDDDDVYYLDYVYYLDDEDYL